MISSYSASEHMERVQHVLIRLHEAGLKLKPEKCELFQKEVNFFGHVINENGLSPDMQNVKRLSIDHVLKF